MPQLRSSNLHSVEYDVESRVLEITFRGGSIYEYADVDQGTYDGLLTATSPGKYFAEHVKDKFAYTKG